MGGGRTDGRDAEKSFGALMLSEVKHARTCRINQGQ